MMSSHWSATA